MPKYPDRITYDNEMEIANILELVERESQKTQLDILLGEHSLILDTLVQENSLIFEKGQYFLNHDAFTENMLCYRSGKSIRTYDRCSSTNDLAHELLETGWRGVVVAEEQSAGKGRRGRFWQSAAGQNLLFSIAVDLPVPIDQVARIPLLWSAEIADLCGLYVKWPNDIVNEYDQKVGGILSSVHAYSKQSTTVVVGVGLNVHQEIFPADLPNASSLRLSKGRSFSRTALLCAILDRLEHPSDQSFALWRSRSRTIGRMVKIGERQGIVTGLREDGALLLDGQPILTGDVELIAHWEK